MSEDFLFRIKADDEATPVLEKAAAEGVKAAERLRQAFSGAPLQVQADTHLLTAAVREMELLQAKIVQFHKQGTVGGVSPQARVQPAIEATATSLRSRIDPTNEASLQFLEKTIVPDLARQALKINDIAKKAAGTQTQFDSGRRTAIENIAKGLAVPDLSSQLTELKSDLARRAALEVKAKDSFGKTYEPTEAEKAQFAADPALKKLATTGRGPTPATKLLAADTAEARLDLAAQIAAQKRADAEAKLATERRLGSAISAGGAVPVEGNEGIYRIEGINRAMLRRTELGAKVIQNELTIDRILQREQVALARVAALEGGRTSPLGSFLGGLTSRGFGNAGAKPPNFQEALGGLAASAGSAVKYSAVYGALFATIGAAADTLQEALDFTDSFTDLGVAMQETGPPSQAFINNLSDIAALSGSNAGEALDAAARGIRIFGDATTQTAAQTQALGESVASVSTRMSLVTGKSLKEASGDMLAIGASFGTGAEGLTGILDSIAAAKRDIGGDPAQISQGLASIGTAAHEAGFNVAETGRLIALVISRTDESGQAAATRLSKIFSILSGTTGQALTKTLGVDSTQPLKDQLEAVAAAYQAAGPRLKGIIRSQLGGTSNVRELLPLLDPKNLDKVFDTSNVGGAGEKEFQRKSTDLVGNLRKIKGGISEFQTQLVQTDIFKPLGAGLLVVGKLIGALNELLKVYNAVTSALPGSQTAIAVGVEAAAARFAYNKIVGEKGFRSTVRGFLPGGGGDDEGTAARKGEVGAIVTATKERATAEQAYILAVVEATKSLQVATVADVAAREAGAAEVATADVVETEARVGGAAKVGLADEAEAAARIAGAERNASAGLFGRTAALGGKGLDKVGGGLGALGRFAFNPVTIALAVTGLAGKSVYDESQKTGAFTASQQATALAGTGDPDKLRKAAEDILTTSKTFQATSHGFLGFLTSGGRDRAVKESEKLAKELRREASTAPSADPRVDKLGIAAFGAATTVKDLTDGITTLTDNGASATERFDLLSQAIGAANVEPAQLAKRIQGNASAATQAVLGVLFDPAVLKKATADDPKAKALSAGIAEAAGRPLPVDKFGHIDRSHSPAALSSELAEVLRGNESAVNALTKPQAELREKVEQATRKAIAKAKPGKDGFLDDATLGRIAAAAVDGLGLKVDSGVRKNLATAVVEKLRSQQTAAIPALNIKESAASAKVKLDFLAKAAQDDLASPSAQGNLNVQRVVTEKLVKDSQAILANISDGEDLTGALEQVAAAKAQRAAVEITGLDQLRRHDQANAKTVSQIAAIGRKASILKALAAVEGGNLAAIVAVFDDANRSIIAAVLAKLHTATETANKLYADDIALGEVTGSGGGITSALQPSKHQQKVARDRAAKKKAAEDARKQEADANKAAGESTAPAKGGVDETGADSGNPLVSGADKTGPTAAEIRAAKAAQYAARVGGASAAAYAELVAARGEIADAGKDVIKQAKAWTDYFNAQRHAREAVEAHNSVLRQLHGDITDPLENARDALKDAQEKLAKDRAAHQAPDVIDADRLDVRQKSASLARTAFEQDMAEHRTKYELGQLSFAAYERYLVAQRNHLLKIKHRSHDEQQELDGVERDLKGLADQLQGQFNLGDIKLPSVYQVRRAVGGDGASQVPKTQIIRSQVDLKVDASPNALKLLTLLGPQATVHTTHYRKV